VMTIAWPEIRSIATANRVKSRWSLLSGRSTLRLNAEFLPRAEGDVERTRKSEEFQVVRWHRSGRRWRSRQAKQGGSRGDAQILAS
jgi:hypothetical protein